MVLITLTRAAGITAFALRTYAIYEGNRFILATLLILGAAAFSFNMGQNVVISCSSNSAANTPLWVGSANGSLTFLDILVTALTTYRLLSVARSGDGNWITRKKDSLTNLILHQGLFYFFSVTLMQILVLILNFVKQSEGANILNPLSLPLSAMVVTRFLLDLREMHARAASSATVVETGTGLSDFHATLPSRGGVGSSILREFSDPEPHSVSVFTSEREEKSLEDEN